MPVLNKSSILVESGSIDLSCIDDQCDSAPRKNLYTRPLRCTPDGKLGVLYKGRVYPLFNDEYCSPLIVLNLQSYDSAGCTHVSEGEVYDIPFAFTPKRFSLTDVDVNWEILVNQFGIYVYINATDNIIEKLVVGLIEKAKYNVLTWDSTDFISEDNVRYKWFIQLSSGLSSSAISKFLTEFFSELDLSNDIKSEAVKLKDKVKSLELKLINDGEAVEGRIKNVNNELSEAYLEIVRLNKLLISHNEDSDPSSVFTNKAKNLKRTNTEKIIGNIMYSIFPNLAFSPEAPKLIITRFQVSQQLWKLLVNLDAGGDVHKKALHGSAGKVGWMEVVKHISTGNDSRGRIYIRDAKGSHKYDVVLHWKKNEIEQNRLIKKLTTYKKFPNPAVVLN